METKQWYESECSNCKTVSVEVFETEEFGLICKKCYNSFNYDISYFGTGSEAYLS